VPKVTTIIVAAGKSNRFQHPETKKPFVLLGNSPVWQHSAQQFRQHPGVCQLILVIAAEDRDRFELTSGAIVNELRIEIVVGGLERADSVENALNRVDSEADFVAIHDAARPCINQRLIDRVLQKAIQTGAAIPAVPVSSTVKKSLDGRFVLQTIEREHLYLAQTPQIFRRDWIVEAYAKRCGKVVSDEAQLLEQHGYPVALVEGSASNLKITLPEDLSLAAAYLKVAES
jgi:2-C-methyl-D-erythritol 4-phosphate cytidylyltransferase